MRDCPFALWSMVPRIEIATKRTLGTLLEMADRFASLVALMVLETVAVLASRT